MKKIVYLDKEPIQGKLTLGDTIIISDPYNSTEAWNAAAFSVLEGEYVAYKRKYYSRDPLPGFEESSEPLFSMVPPDIYISDLYLYHKDYQDVEPVDIIDKCIGIDSGQCGIYDYQYFDRIKKDKELSEKWLLKIDESTTIRSENKHFMPYEKSFYKNIETELDENSDLSPRDVYESNAIRNSPFITTRTATILDENAVLVASGFGNGLYTCLIGRNKDGIIVSVRVVFIPDEEEEKTWKELDL